MALGTPYRACGGNAGSGSATLTVTVTHTSSLGDCLAVWVTSNAGIAITSVTDSQSNPYIGQVTATTGAVTGRWWVCQNAKALTASADTITVTLATGGGSKTLSAFGCSGVETAGGIDQVPAVTSGTSTAPSIATGTLTQASQLCLAGLVNGTGGGSVTWGNTFASPPVSDSQHPGTSQWGQAAAATVNSKAAVTGSGTISSAAWAMSLLTLRAFVTRIGATVAKNIYGGSDWQTAANTVNGYVGVPIGGTCGKIYMDAESGWTAYSLPNRADWQEQVTAGNKMLISVKPNRTVTSAERANFANWILQWQQAGAIFDLCLWQEGNEVTAFPTPQSYQAYYQAYASTVRGTSAEAVAAGIKPVALVYDPGGNKMDQAVTYYPGDAYVDRIVCDYYGGSYTAHTPRLLDQPFGATTTIASGSNGLSLPQATIHVASTSSFTASSGTLCVVTSAGPQSVTYGGMTGTTFTGCTGGTGMMSTGGAINPSLMSLADNHTPTPIPFGLWEWNAVAVNTTLTLTQWNQYVGYLTGLFTGREGAGTLTCDIALFLGSTIVSVPITQDQINSSSDFKIPAGTNAGGQGITTLWNALTGPSAAVAVTATFTLTASGQSTGGTVFAGAAISGTFTLSATGSATSGAAVASIAMAFSLATSGTGVPLVIQQVAGTSTFDYGMSTTQISTMDGSTLLVLAGWDLSTQPTSAPMPAVWVSDSSGANCWIPVATTSASVTGSRCSAWICPHAEAIQWLTVSLSAFASSLAYMVLELDGTVMPQFYVLDVLDAISSAAASSLALNPGTTVDNDFAFAVFAQGGYTRQPTVTGPVWQSLGSVTAGSAAGNSQPNLPGNAPVANSAQVWPYYLTPGPGTNLATTFGQGQAIPSSAIVFAIRSTVFPPFQDEGVAFPVLRVQAGLGFTPGDPTQAPPALTDITNRVMAAEGQTWIATKAGRQYELATPETGTLNLAVDNHDGAFTPGAASAFPGLALKVPVYVTAYTNGSWFPVAMGYIERLPQEWPDLPQWSTPTIVATDALGAAAAVTMLNALDSDILLDQPYVLISASEQYLSFSNGLSSIGGGAFALGFYTTSDAQGLLAQNYSRVNQRNGMYVDGVGLGGSALTSAAIATTGQTTSLLGSANTGFGTGSFSTTAPTAPVSGPGIVYTDPSLPGPSSANGVTVSFWVIIPATVASTTLQPVVFTAWGPPSNYSTTPSLQVLIQNFTGSNTLQVTLANGTTITAPFNASASAQMITLAVTSSSLNIYVNGALQTTTALTSAEVTSWRACAWGCPNYAYGTGTASAGDFTVFDCAIYPYQLPVQRIVSNYATGISGQQNVDATVRVAQILSWAGLGLARGGQQTFNGVSEDVLQGPAYSLSGQTASANLAQVAANESGMIAAQPGGSLVFFHKWSLFNQQPQCIFGDSPVPGAGEIPYLQVTSWDYDDTYLWNTEQVTQQYGANNLFTVQSSDTTSQADYFARTPRTQTITTMSSLDATGAADWAIAKYSQPSLRVSGVTIDAASLAASSPGVYATILALQQGQVVTVTRRPVGGAEITQNCLIQRISYAIGPGLFKASYQLSPYTPDSRVLQLDAAGFNEPGTGVLA